MGAYNWLRAEIMCYHCARKFPSVLQVQIGWCRYQEYALGDRIDWMDHDTCKEARLHPELRTLVQHGLPARENYAVSTGDDHVCPSCGATGTILAIVKDNRFAAVLFTPLQVRYSEIVPGTEIDRLSPECPSK